MNRTGSKIALTLTVAVSVFSILVLTAATAQIGASSEPLDTNGPDLLSAEGGGSNATFCFDESIDDDEIEPDGEGFHVTGYNDDIEMEADEADEADDSKCVDVEFDDDLRISETTVAYVDVSSIEDATGTPNPLGTVAFGPDRDFGGLGSTAAPDLEDYDINEGANQVTYDFDQRIDETGDFSYSAGDFGVYDEDGDRFTGDTITVGTNEVTVTFSENLDDDSVRVDVEHGAVGSQETDDDDRYLNPFGAQGDDETDNPDLETVERRDEDTFRFHFDEDLDQDADDGEEKFHLYAEDGDELDGDEIDVDNEYADVDFEDADDVADSELPLAAAESGAVESDAGSDDSTGGTFALAEPGEVTGYTDAPDLVRAEEEATSVHLTFDEEVSSAYGSKIYVINDARATTVSSGIDVDDPPNSTSTAVRINATEMSVNFPADVVSSAVGVVLASGAALDYQGNHSVPTAIGFSTDSVTSIISSLLTSTATSTATPSPSPTPLCERSGVILGTDASDVLRGTGKADVICSKGGDDFVQGLGGADTIILGDGDDVAVGGGGKDELNGQLGDDELKGSGGSDTLIGGDGNDFLNGQGGLDTCRDSSGTNRLRSCEKG